jgi:hypothetical protein
MIVLCCVVLVERIIQLLRIWLDDQAQNLCSEFIILTKVECFYDDSKWDIVKDMPSFSASHLWVRTFKIEEYLHNLKSTGEAASAHTDATLAYLTQFVELIEEGGCCVRDDTELLWNKMAQRTCLAKQDESAETQTPARTGLSFCLVVM